MGRHAVGGIMPTLISPIVRLGKKGAHGVALSIPSCLVVWYGYLLLANKVSHGDYLKSFYDVVGNRYQDGSPVDYT